MLISLSLSSCESETVNENILQGKWSMIKLIGSFSPPEVYNHGDLTWFFDFNNKVVTINNGVELFDAKEPPSFSNNQSGAYSFEIKTENEVEYLIVGDRKGIITIVAGELTIDYGIAFDDIAYVFKR